MKKSFEKIEESFKKRFKILGKKDNSNSIKKEPKLDIIDKFLSLNTQDLKIKVDNIKGKNDIDLSKSSTSKVKVVSETLAEIHKTQNNYDLAIDIYKQLIIKTPTKEDYYNQKIIELEILNKGQFRKNN